MQRREYLQLASTWTKKGSVDISGWFWSEKLDGMRALWDGGISRGMLKKHIPWANNAHDFRYKNEPVATGLWTRLGNVIHAPDWFLDQLPRNILLDGELFSHAIDRESLFGTVKTLTPGTGWQDVHYYLFDAPPPATFFLEGEVKNPNFNRVIKVDYTQWDLFKIPPETRYVDILGILKGLPLGGNIHLLDQNRLPNGPSDADTAAESLAEVLVDRGGEGIVIRHPLAPYRVERSKLMIKIKGYEESEGTLVDTTPGEGKYEGMVGALVIEWKNKRFQLSGMTDEQRQPGYFKDGSQVTFRYRRLSADGLPMEARFIRVRDYER